MRYVCTAVVSGKYIYARDVNFEIFYRVKAFVTLRNQYDVNFAGKSRYFVSKVFKYDIPLIELLHTNVCLLI